MTTIPKVSPKSSHPIATNPINTRIQHNHIYFSEYLQSYCWLIRNSIQLLIHTRKAHVRMRISSTIIIMTMCYANSRDFISFALFIYWLKLWKFIGISSLLLAKIYWIFIFSWNFSLMCEVTKFNKSLNILVVCDCMGI